MHGRANPSPPRSTGRERTRRGLTRDPPRWPLLGSLMRDFSEGAPPCVQGQRLETSCGDWRLKGHAGGRHRYHYNGGRHRYRYHYNSFIHSFVQDCPEQVRSYHPVPSPWHGTMTIDLKGEGDVSGEMVAYYFRTKPTSPTTNHMMTSPMQCPHESWLWLWLWLRLWRRRWLWRRPLRQ